MHRWFDDLPAETEALVRGFLDALDRHGGVETAGRYVARHLTLGHHDAGALIATLIQAVLREDAGFHSYQMLEASIAQFREWDPTPEGLRILYAAARYPRRSLSDGAGRFADNCGRTQIGARREAVLVGGRWRITARFA